MISIVTLFIFRPIETQPSVTSSKRELLTRNAEVLVAATRNFSSIFVLRFFLGAVESAFFPLVIFYLTTFYRRSELARRLAIFYAASNIANAFSGLLAFGVFQIKSNLVDHPWRWLFIIEGTLTVLFALFVFFYLPKSAAEAKFLNED